jgi:hypothetical protein
MTCNTRSNSDVSGSFLQYRFCQPYTTLVLSTPKTTCFPIRVFGEVTKGRSKPTISSVPLLDPKYPPPRLLSRVSRWGGQRRMLIDSTRCFEYFTDATPRSPGIVTFLHVPFSHSKAAPAASEIKVHGKSGGASSVSANGNPSFAASITFFQIHRSSFSCWESICYCGFPVRIFSKK